MLSSGGGEEEVAAGWGSSWVWGKYQFEKLVLSWKAPLRKRGLALLRYWIWKMNRCGLAKCIYGCYNSKQSCAFLQQSVLHEVKTNAEALKGGCRGTICNQVPSWICTPRLPLVNFQKCAELSHPPRAENPATVMRGTGGLLNICGWSGLVMLCNFHAVCFCSRRFQLNHEHVSLHIYSAAEPIKICFSFFLVEAGLQMLVFLLHLCLFCATLLTCRRCSWCRPG